METRDLSFLAIPFDHYGFANPQGLGHYRGPLPAYRKESGLEPYRYSLAVEAVDEANYVTEKFFDCILSETLPFYWGCSNLEEWFDSDCFIRLDLDDSDVAFRTLREAIEADEWARRLPAIRRAKARILDEYNLFPILEAVLRDLV